MRACFIVITALLSLAAASCQTDTPACFGDTPAARAVCGNAMLRDLQAELARQLVRSNSESRLVAAQMTWSNNRDALCPMLNTMCLAAAYEERIALVKSWGDQMGSSAGSVGTAPLSIYRFSIGDERVSCTKAQNSALLERCTLVAYFALTVSLVRPFTVAAHCDVAYEFETADHERHQRNERHPVAVFGFGPSQRAAQFIAFGPGLTIQDPVISVTFKNLSCGLNSIV
jgi:uncharacterized protein